MNDGPPASNRQEPAAVVRGVTATFDSYLTRALVDVNFEIHRGEIFGLVGPHGSGKSALLRILAGRLRPTEGKLRILGKSPRRASSSGRVSYLPGLSGPPAKTGLWGALARLFGRQRTAERLDPSGTGMQRRSGLAQAVIGTHDFLILDDPFGGLGESEAFELRGVLAALAGRGKTIVLSSRSLFEAKGTCSRVAILHDGRVQGIGTPGELLSLPDALRVIAAVLPAHTAECALNLIREQMSAAADPARAPGAALNSSNPPPSSAGASESVLSPLLSPAAPPPSASSPGTTSRPVGSDAVDHVKLAKLTRPDASLSESAGNPGPERD